MKKMIVLVIFLMIVTACTSMLPPAPISRPVSDLVEIIPCFVDTVFMEVLSFYEDSIQLCVTNNAERYFTFPPCGQRRRSPEHSGIFSIDYFNGEHWMEVIPTPYTPESLPPSHTSALIDHSYRVEPGEYVITTYCLKLHPIPMTEIGLYRVRMDIFIWAYYRVELNHTLVAEFYWHGG